MLAMKSALIEKGVSADSIFVPDLDDEIVLTGAGTPTLKPSHVQRVPRDALGGPDWHNDLTELVFELRDAFEQAADEKARAKVLRRVKRALRDAN